MSSEILRLTPSETYDFITAALACRHVPYVAGAPAIGKSQVVHQVANDANALMIDMRLSQMLSEDMTGLPERDQSAKKATYLPFDRFPLEGDTIPKGYSGWLLFLDELSSASEEVLAAAYSLILDREVGGKKLHPKCLVVAAGNRATDSAIARELPDTLITRMLPIEMKISHRDWLDWATRKETKSNEAVVEFIKKNPSLLYAPTKAKERAELETYPTPRGWEKVFAHMSFHEKNSTKMTQKEDAAGLPVGDPQMVAQPIPDLVFNLMAAAVGHMAARSFREDYDDSIQLPYPWEIAQSPSSVRIPNSNVGKARITTDLVKYFVESDNQTRDGVLSYMNRIGGEYSELFVSHLKGALGNTASDGRLLESTAKRLSIDPLLGTAPKGGASSEAGSF
jgi:hypothetical protein